MISRKNQAERVLEALRGGPKTSWELQALGVCSHTSRISELRKDGWQITREDRWQGGKRTVTYWLTGKGCKAQIAGAPTDDLERSRTLTGGTYSLRCTECGTRVKRKAKARPLKPSELPFCKDSCRSAHWKRRKTVEAQQSLVFEQELQERRA